MDRPIDRIIRDAMAEGKFDDLPGKGKPLSTRPDGTPPELDMAFTVLKNAGYVPQEVEWMKEIESLTEQLAGTHDPDERGRIERAIQDRRLRVNLFLEGLRRG